ncbi:hypothetical protein [Nocardioides sp.]|uniref:hypothetical protein n=1 Tax=Nocardioides sp. TaxID=35761 RepID=UPI0039E2CD50
MHPAEDQYERDVTAAHANAEAALAAQQIAAMQYADACADQAPQKIRDAALTLYIHKREQADNALELLELIRDHGMDAPRDIIDNALRRHRANNPKPRR